MIDDRCFTTPHRGRRSGGFTLIEVMVAMVVMAILAVMAWQGVDGIVRSRDASSARLEQALRLNTVIAQWEQDLASVQDSGVVPAFAFDGANLRLTRRTPSGLQLVMWSLGGVEAAANAAAVNTDPNAGAGGRWLRWAAPVTINAGDLQQQWLRSQQLPAGDTAQLAMLAGVLQWQVYCFRGNDNAWSNCQSSNDRTTTVTLPNGTPPVPVRDALPTGVRTVLSFADGSGLAGKLTRDIALGPQTP